MGWSIAQRAEDLERESRDTAARREQEAGMRRMSVARMKRAIIRDDEKRS